MLCLLTMRSFRACVCVFVCVCALVSFPDSFRKNREGVWQHVLHCGVQKEFNQLLNHVLKFTHASGNEPFSLNRILIRKFFLGGSFRLLMYCLRRGKPNIAWYFLYFRACIFDGSGLRNTEWLIRSTSLVPRKIEGQGKCARVGGSGNETTQYRPVKSYVPVLRLPGGFRLRQG